MGLPSILLLALGVAADATAVAAARGCAARTLEPLDFLKVAGLFAGFQVLMPLLGFFLGTELGTVIEAWDHWLAFVLLSGVGGKMLWEAQSVAEAESLEGASSFAWGPLVVLAIATSLDAFAVGITLPVMGAPLLLTLTVIGFVTGLLSAMGLAAGRRFGALFGRHLDRAGGLILIGLGMRILITHLGA